jgi:hypothetical protein
LVLHLRSLDRIEFQREAIILRQGLQQRDRLLAIGGVEIEETNLLAFELVEATFDVGGMTDKG